MRGIWPMMLRELKSLRQEKTILFAILIQFFLASFSSVILLGIMVYYDPDTIGQNAQYGLTVGVLGNRDSRFIRYVAEGGHRTVIYSDTQKAEEAFKAGQLDAIAYLPDESKGEVEMKLVLPDMDAQATVVLMLLRKPLEKYENHLRLRNGISLRYQNVGGRPFSTYEFLYTIILPILMFFPAFIAGSMVIDSITEEIENKTLDTLLSAPVSLLQISGAKILASLLVGLAQCLLWIALLGLNGFKIENAALIMTVSLLATGIIALLALYVAMFFRDRERSQFIYSLVVLLLFSAMYFINPSPFALIARLATGDPAVGWLQLPLYLMVLAALTAALPWMTRRITSSS